ncbi:MAG: M12 family metallo-peptidase [Woeseiaceae bacterium]|nr:M12 family metallo-peptidase [Woeseiaceae bacterium]
MKTFTRCMATGLALLVACSAFAADSNIRIRHSESLQRLVVETNTNVQAVARAQRGMRFEAMGREFDFSLEPNRTLLRAIGNRLPDGVDVFRGELAGTPGSWARFVITGGVPQGMFFDGTELYAVEAGADGAIVYRLADLEIAPGTLGCSHVASAKSASELVQAVKDELPTAAQAPGAVSNIDIGLVADFEFTSDKGANTNSELIARMNIVDGIFSSQLGVQLTVTEIDTFPDSNDPFSNETNSSNLIDEVADYRFDTPEQNAAGLTHLFTGRELDGSTVGIAFGGALCRTRFGAGLTQGTHSTMIDALIAAHEIGHNFGAPHDAEVGSPCESEPADFLMAPAVNGSDQFSACSITEMQDDVAAAACISPLPSTDVAVVAGSAPTSVFTDDAVSVTFDVNSVGTEDANNVVLNVTLPTNVTVNSVTATAGNCTMGAGNANCVLGTVAGGSGVTVTLDTVASAAGNAVFTATSTADGDANPNNNQALVSFNVDAAVDLAVLPAPSANLDLNQSTTIRPTLENRSSLAATGVTLTITPTAGLRIDSASWAAGTCAVGGNGVATCQAASIAGMGSETLTVGVTGTAEGTQSYTVAVSANELDSDASNNDRSGQVTVGAIAPPPEPEESSGGGAFDGLLLLLLGLLGIARRRPSA